jgi:hypothetical protein
MELTTTPIEEAYQAYQAVRGAEATRLAKEFKKRYGQGINAYGDAKLAAQAEANYNDPDTIADSGRRYDLDRLAREIVTAGRDVDLIRLIGQWRTRGISRKRCAYEYCGGPDGDPTTMRNPRRTFCSPACRQAAYRLRLKSPA